MDKTKNTHTVTMPLEEYIFLRQFEENLESKTYFINHSPFNKGEGWITNDNAVKELLKRIRDQQKSWVKESMKNTELINHLKKVEKMNVLQFFIYKLKNRKTK